MSRRHIFVALMALGAGSNAMAAGTVLVTLASPTLKQEQILEGIVWRCIDTTCRSVSAPTTAVGVQTCKGIAKKFGQVVTFVAGDKPLDEESLAKCNESAK